MSELHERRVTRLRGELRAMFDAVDPVPDEVQAVARGALGLRTLDAELAALTMDSADAPLAGIRSDAATRLLTFAAADLEIEVQVSATTGGRRHVVGQLIPPAPLVIAVQTPETEQTTTADALGRFTFPDVPAGSLRIQCTGSDHGPIVTDWLTI